MIDEPLSPEGVKRRDAILLLAKAEARRRRNHRVVSRGVVAVTLVTALCLVIRQNPVAERPAESKSSVAKLVPVPSIRVEYLQTDSTITDRLTLRPSPPRWTNIGDDELLQELAAAGQPAGIVSMQGKTILLSRAETR